MQISMAFERAICIYEAYYVISDLFTSSFEGVKDIRHQADVG